MNTEGEACKSGHAGGIVKKGAKSVMAALEQ